MGRDDTHADQYRYPYEPTPYSDTGAACEFRIYPERKYINWIMAVEKDG